MVDKNIIQTHKMIWDNSGRSSIVSLKDQCRNGLKNMIVKISTKEIFSIRDGTVGYGMVFGFL